VAIILHADMDAFYASIEQRDNPELAGLPVVVGGAGKRGVIAAASYEARKFGVRSAMPSVQAKRLCPDVVFVRGRMKVYAEVSAKVREIFYRYTPVVEPLSLDEAYLDVGGSIRLFGSPREIAEGIRRDVRDELRLAVSVGGGPGKLVAKIASKKAKPDGVFLVEEESALAFLHPLPVREIWGVGRVTEGKLHDLGIATIGQLADFDAAALERALGTWGPLLHSLANGDDLRTVECDRGRKSYGEENTFAEDAVDRDTIEATVIAHAETVAARLRHDGIRARTITFKYRPSGPEAEFRLVTRSKTLEQGTDDGGVIAATAMQLWDREPEGIAVRLIGIQTTGLDGDRPVQLGLFQAPEEDARTGALNSALDEITAKFGPAAVKRGRT
jgi:DNA polymerase-4